MATNSTNGNEDFISKFDRFGQALKHYEWLLNNPPIVFIVFLGITLIISYFGIPIDPIVSLMTALTKLFQMIKGS